MLDFDQTNPGTGRGKKLKTAKDVFSKQNIEKLNLIDSGNMKATNLHIPVMKSFEDEDENTFKTKNSNFGNARDFIDQNDNEQEEKKNEAKIESPSTPTFQ